MIKVKHDIDISNILLTKDKYDVDWYSYNWLVVLPIQRRIGLFKQTGGD